MIKKVCIITLIFGILCIQVSPNQRDVAYATSDHTTIAENSQPPFTEEALATIGLIGACAVLFWLTAPDNVRQEFLNQLHPGMLLINALKEYATWSYATLSHEAGHASAQYLITGQWGALHFGATSHKDTPYAQIGNIHIDGFSPIHGHTENVFTNQDELASRAQIFYEAYCRDNNLNRSHFTTEQMQELLQSEQFEQFRQAQLPPRTHYAAYLIAGGIAGLIAYHSAQKLITNRIQPTSVSCNQIYNAFIPFHKGSDGTILWRDCLHVPEPVIDAFLTLAPFIDVMTEVYCTHLDLQTTNNAPLHSKFLIAFINYLTRGYLRFHA